MLVKREESSDRSLFVNQSPQSNSGIFAIKSALVELFLFFLIFYTAHYLLTGSLNSSGLSPHPFWIPVLMLSVQYGAAQGVLAALAATAGIFLPGIPEQTSAEDFNTYLIRVAAEPVIWVLAAILIGSFRDWQRRQLRSLVIELNDAREQRSLIGEHCKKLRSRNKSLQHYIARARLRSIPSAYRAIEKLRATPLNQISDSLATCMDMLVSAEKFSIYKLHRNTLTLAVSKGWSVDDTWAHQFGEEDELYQSILSNLFLTNNTDGGALDRQGLFALPILSAAKGTVIGMLKVEKIAKQDVTSETVSYLQFLAEQLAPALEEPERNSSCPVCRGIRSNDYSTNWPAEFLDKELAVADER